MLKRAGRPSKEEVERELKTDAKAAKEIKTVDLERIGLKVVNGKDSCILTFLAIMPITPMVIFYFFNNVVHRSLVW